MCFHGLAFLKQWFLGLRLLENRIHHCEAKIRKGTLKKLQHVMMPPSPPTLPPKFSTPIQIANCNQLMENLRPSLLYAHATVSFLTFRNSLEALPHNNMIFFFVIHS